MFVFQIKNFHLPYYTYKENFLFSKNVLKLFSACFPSYGVIAAPEVTDWQSLTANDSYLVVGSDGVFEKLSLQDVCDLLWEVKDHAKIGSRLSSSCSLSLADCLVNTAYEKGSMDNMATVVVPLGSAYLSQSLQTERCIRNEDKEFPANGLQKVIYERSGKYLVVEFLLDDFGMEWVLTEFICKL